MSMADAFGAMAEVADQGFAAMFPDLCAIHSPTNTTGTSGGTRPTYTAVAGLSEVPCLYAGKRGIERDAAGATTAFTDFEILLPAQVGDTLVSVVSKSRIVVAARSPQPARTFEAVSVVNEAGTYLRVQAVLRNA